jgi:hypothetical protein
MSIGIAKQPVKDETFRASSAISPRGGTADATDLKSVASTTSKHRSHEKIGDDPKSAKSEFASARPPAAPAPVPPPPPSPAEGPQARDGKAVRA